MNFQAAVTAIAAVYLARGRPLLWLEGLIDDVPVAISAETGGAGDDVRIAYRNGSTSEVQIKRGLQAGAVFWNALLKLAHAIYRREIDYGVLIVCPNSSQPIARGLAQDMGRLAEGRYDSLGKHAKALKQKLEAICLPVQSVCARLRIVTVHALAYDQASIAAARSELDHICRNKSQIGSAWDRLYRDAAAMIEFRTARRASSVMQVLKSAGIDIATDALDTPVAMLSRLSDWVIKANTYFTILGVRQRLSVDDAWIPVQAIVRDATPAEEGGLAEALERYHTWDQQTRPPEKTLIEADTLGRFYRHVVVIAGPGTGKTTLLTRLARRYAEDGFPTLRVGLQALAVRMRARGSGFEESLFELGLDGSSLRADDIQAARLDEWVLLCDGLDECGPDQEAVADGLIKFVAGHPRCRVIVTSRPIGYRAANLSDWRHYNLAPLDHNSASTNLARLIRNVVGEEDSRHAAAMTLATSYLQHSRVGELVTRSPLLLGIVASLFVRGGQLGRSRAQLYAGVFKLLDDEPSARVGSARIAASVLGRFLDILGWIMIGAPLNPVNTTLEVCAAAFAGELNCSRLNAQQIAEACLRYWQDVGLLERVQHRGEETLTFIHKTFAEYAAARYLAAVPEPDKWKAITARIGQDAWSEVFSFAVTLGLGSIVCEALLDGLETGEAAHRITVRCVTLATESHPALTKEIIQRVLERAFAEVCSERRQWAFEVGATLSQAAKQFPTEVGPRAAALLDDTQPWTKLAAWACSVEAGPDYYDLERLPVALKELMSTMELGSRSSLGGGVIFGGGGRKLVESFALSATRQILDRCKAEVADAILPEVLGAETFGTWGFHREVRNLLSTKGKHYEIGKVPGAAIRDADLINPPEGYYLAQRSWYLKALGALMEAGDEGAATPASLPHSRLLYLAALLQLSEFWESPAYDVWAWDEPYDEEAAREVLRGFARWTRLPGDRLALEVRTFLNTVRTIPDDRIFELFDLAPLVDAPAPDSAQAKQLGLDPAKLEAAFYHGSEWLVKLAASLLAESLDSEALRAVTARLFAQGRGFTLQAAAGVAARLAPGVAAELAYERLRAPLVPGCEHLYALLTYVKALNEEEATAALRAGLHSRYARIAVAAADFALIHAKPGAESLYSLLREAYAHWQQHEEPYPTKGGVIPPSPREKLLLGMAAIRPPEYRDLLRYVEDPRSDIREIGTNALLAHLTKSSEARCLFADSAVAGKVSPHLIGRVLKAKIPFDQSEIKTLGALFMNQDSKVRYAALGLLDRAYLSQEDMQAQARAMTQDTEQEIRDVAYRFID